MRILVTGATGFIGGHLCKRLFAEGHEVAAFVRQTSDVARLDGRVHEIVTGDLGNIDSLARAMANVEAVCHLAAALVAAKPTPELYRAVNVDGTRNVCNAMVQAGVKRLLYCSSVGVFGPIKTPPADESYPKQPQGDYEKTKRAAEEIVLEHMHDQSLAATVLRPAIVYGPEDTHSGIFSLFRAIARRRFRIIGGGQNRMHMLYVDNLIDAFLLALERESSIGRDYNIGDAVAPSFRAVCKAIAREQGVRFPRLGVPVWIAWPLAFVGDIMTSLGLNVPVNSRSVTFLTTHRSYDISRARRELGYAPAVDLDEGVRRTVEWYRTHGHLP